MRVLVAGASGAIGMPLVRLLRHDGHEVIAVHRAPEGRARLAEAGAAPVQADVLNCRGLSQALDGQQADAVIAHLAALRANEQQVLGAPGVDGIALRYGQLYGPGPANDALVAALRQRRLPVTRTSAAVPWVYIDDAASATVAALELGE